MDFDQIIRKIILTAAQNPIIQNTISKYGMNWGVRRFVAGEKLSEALETVKKLNGQRLLVTLDYLGESVADRVQAAEAAHSIVQIFPEIARHGLKSNVSVKLTQLGLAIDPAFCLENMDRITAEAKKYNNFVRIDMEDSAVTQATIDIFKTLLQKYGKEHIGVVIQSYLYRSEKDVLELGELGANLRIVKGAYKEPRDVAYPLKKDVDRQFQKLVELHLGGGHYTAIASHDPNMIEHAKRFAAERGITNDRFEFQMLHGIASSLQLQLVEEGYKVRVYTPFGAQWYPYFTRRIAERPANAVFVLKGLFRK